MQERTPQQPPVIPPLPATTHRTKWSVMIPAYNCAAYLTRAIESVLEQAPAADEMQIEVIDDFSTDADIGALVANAGKGRVGYYRQPANVGSLRNFETCINRARGELVHILHGDDFVKPGYYKEIEKLFALCPDAGAAFTDFIYVNHENRELQTEKKLLAEPGIIDNWLFRLAEGNRIQAPCITVKRKVYEQLGSFFAVHYGEDWEMWVRIAAHYPVVHSPGYFACYRIHQTNISTRYYETGQNIKDISKVINIICQHHLPKEMKEVLRKKARKNFSWFFSDLSHILFEEQGNAKAALVQARHAFLLNKNGYSARSYIKLYLKIRFPFMIKTFRHMYKIAV
ncbi:glycosyltransferase family 2 protein [Deminuibacter soli]|uniref:Glycosyltransferase n=1 Tax=Deminuibacter soli TaxID=2291815 RepID=A0A3E1NME7_9BACT|nr:glycosyltransferase [Deminuibacter soli]RFM29093.1 glycosyltransferase [Deminuibacter soli]